jgi:2-polyprenyl-6-methoxyphenol hydroxylase-like FAD-dependent oxidoreductase
MSEQTYDVVIMGGGPAGSTMGALLQRHGGLRVAIVEREVFPREHIGESLVHSLMPILEETGALPKVLASNCWVKKFGGIFGWERNKPSATYFDHLEWQQDGIHRWAIHCNRSEFDKILLDHTESLGVEVIQGVSVERYEPGGDHGLVTLSDGRRVISKFFVDASGRQTGLAIGGRHQHLSEYRNLAVWNHYINCKPAQELQGAWNIFANSDRSPIACYAFEHGWSWYIPVPKFVNGKRTLTYSIGIVTDPAYLKSDHDFTNPKIFLEAVRTIEGIRDLTRDAVAVNEEMMVTQNYSMICDKFCDFDERWILVGDAAYFVDPLFSSGVTFAAAMAGVASVLVCATTDSTFSARDKRAMWADYTREWVGIAQSFGLAIDQWYHAISEDNPGSVYWKRRSGHSKALGIRQSTFQALVDTAITPDLMQVLTHGSHELSDLSQSGAFLSALGRLHAIEPHDNETIQLTRGVELVDSITVDVPGFKASLPPLDPPKHLRETVGQYWRDPVANGALLPSPFAAPLRCKRITRLENGSFVGQDVPFVEERSGGLELFQRLKRGPANYGELRNELRPAQRRLLKQLLVAGLVERQSEHQGDAVATG